MTTYITLPQPNSDLPIVSPVGINDSGVIAGTAPVIGVVGEDNGFVYKDGATTLLADGAGYSLSTPTGINDSGEIVGSVQTGLGADYQAVAWNNGSPTFLSPLVTGEFSNALGVNEQSDVVGLVSLASGSVTSVVWLGGGAPTVLADPTGFPFTEAIGINNSDQIVGWAATSVSTSAQSHLVLWSTPTSAPIDLGVPTGYSGARGLGINSSGEIFGNAYGGAGTAFTWQNGQFTVLPILTGFSSATAKAMNDEGQVVGYASNGSTFHAVLWQNGQAVDLSNLVNIGATGYDGGADGINDYGQIAADGIVITPSTMPGTIPMPTLSASSPNGLLVDLLYAPFNPSAMKFTLSGSTLSVMEGTANLGSSTLSNATGLTSANFYVVEDANGGTEIHVSSSAAAVASFTITDTTLGTTTSSPGVAYSGPVTGLQYQYISTGSDSVNVTANIADVFLHGGTGGNNALAALSGQNVLDGGQGSNFLVGVAATTATPTGQDTFFVDGRGTAAVWSTVVNFHQGDAATIWGVTSTTAIETVANAGATGYQGFTIHADTLGNGSYSSSITLAGVSQAHVSETFGTVGGTPYLYLTYV